MKIIGLYTWMIGTKSEYIQQFKSTESLYQRANTFWRDVEGSVSLVFIIMLVVGILFASLYYTWWNNKPNRHYTAGAWVWFIIWACLMTFLLSFGIEILEASPDGGKEWLFITKLAGCNTVYTTVIYILTSVIWCNFLPTNACRIFKIGRVS